MRRAGALLAATLLLGCPSLDGFAGGDKAEAGVSGGGFLSLADAARVCSKVVTCPELDYAIGFSLLLPMEPTTFSTCVDVLAGPLPPGRSGKAEQTESLTCVAKATNCAAAAACLPYEFPLPGDPRCQLGTGGADAGADGGGGSSNPSRCSGDGKSVLHCGYDMIVHCGHGHFGESSCVVDSNDVPRCVAATTCTVNAPMCSSTTSMWCDAVDKFTYETNCGYWGAGCGADQATGSYFCLVNGAIPECSTDGVQCVSGRVRACYGGYFGDIDCPVMGSTCNPYPMPHCSPPSAACKQTDSDLNVCQGSQLALCVGGKRQTLDCASIGLGCAQGPSSGYCG